MSIDCLIKTPVTTASRAMHSVIVAIPMGHAAFAGHFPGRPVVPGVLLLDTVIDASEKWLGHRLNIIRLTRAKFLAPLLPGEKARLDLVLQGQGIDFSIETVTAVIAKGCLVLGPAVES